jgi:hypothetical protein
MKFYILKPKKYWQPWYDKTFGVIVRAENESEARQLASKMAGDEGSEVWLDPSTTVCDILLAEGPPEVIMVDFKSA